VSEVKLKNKRLSNHDRNVLRRFANKQIGATQESVDLDNAYEHAAEAVHAEVVKRWPQKDMQVLAKYDAASRDACVFVAGNSEWDYEQFNFKDDDKRIPFRPSRSNCRRLPIQLEGDAAQAFAAYLKARTAHEAAIEKRQEDFSALIWNTTNFNALAEIWPAAEALRGEIVGHSASLSVLSEEVVDRLKADPALLAA